MKIKNLTAVNNGGAGIHFHNHDGQGVEITNAHLENNAGGGILFTKDRTVHDALGLRSDADLKELAALMKKMEGKGELDRRSIIGNEQKSWSKYVVNAASFVANMMTITGLPTVAKVIQQLEGM